MLVGAFQNWILIVAARRGGMDRAEQIPQKPKDVVIDSSIVLPRREAFTLTLHKMGMPPHPSSLSPRVAPALLHRRGERAGRGASATANERSSCSRKASFIKPS